MSKNKKQPSIENFKRKDIPQFLFTVNLALSPFNNEVYSSFNVTPLNEHCFSEDIIDEENEDFFEVINQVHNYISFFFEGNLKNLDKMWHGLFKHSNLFTGHFLISLYKLDGEQRMGVYALNKKFELLDLTKIPTVIGQFYTLCTMIFNPESETYKEISEAYQKMLEELELDENFNNNLLSSNLKNEEKLLH